MQWCGARVTYFVHALLCLLTSADAPEVPRIVSVKKSEIELEISDYW